MNYQITVRAVFEINGQKYNQTKTYKYTHYDPVLNPNGLYTSKDFQYLKEKSKIDFTNKLIAFGANKIKCAISSENN